MKEIALAFGMIGMLLATGLSIVLILSTPNIANLIDALADRIRRK